MSTDPVRSSVGVTALDLAAGEHLGRVRAMATDVLIRVPRAASEERMIEGVEAALEVFRRVEAACTRFDPESPLMRANVSPERWHRVPAECFAAIVAAHCAYMRTKGVFDPRILKDLVGLGYDRSLPFAQGDVRVAGGATTGTTRRRDLGAWRPRFRGATSEVLIGHRPIDLGGIGKGLAIAWASDELSAVAPDHLIEAGGDCWCGGASSERTPWRIGIEDPEGGGVPVGVLELSNLACATSSTRVRRWHAGGREVHHLVDPRTGRPGGDGLSAVTVVGDDPALAEVWSKTLFLAGAREIGRVAARKGLAAIWVTAGGGLHSSRDADRYLIWRR
jgi:thiamine biosynthesis lipoprotein